MYAAYVVLVDFLLCTGRFVLTDGVALKIARNDFE